MELGFLVFGDSVNVYLASHKPLRPGDPVKALTTVVSPQLVDLEQLSVSVATHNATPILDVRHSILTYPEMPPDPAVGIKQVEHQYFSCAGCHLSEERTRVVFFRGNPYSPVLAIGEGPGKTEDIQGTPFCGRSGRLQDELFREVGIQPNAHVGWANLVGCFVGDVEVSSPRIEKGYRRAYSGPLVQVRTGRNILTGTPNHPVLTPRGWVPLGALVEGDSLVRCVLREGVGARDPHVEDGPARFDELFGTLSLDAVRERVVGSHMDFHGDGAEAEIEVVAHDGLLGDGFESSSPEHLAHPTFDESLLEPAGRNPQAVRDSLPALASEVAFDRVLEVRRLDVDASVTHVYNLQTSEGWYTANGYIVSNCRPCDNRFAKDRPPTLAEKAACSERTLMLLRALRPRIVLCLGKEAASMFWPKEAIDKPAISGLYPNTWHTLTPQDEPRDWVVVGYVRHPAGLVHMIQNVNAYKEYISALLFYERLRNWMSEGLEKVSKWRFGFQYLSGVTEPVVGGRS